jgi:hypothetical protein
MNIDIETDISLRLETIKSLLEHLLVLDEQEYNNMMESKYNIGFTKPQLIAIENCLEDIFNDSDNFVNITNYRKQIYDFRMGLMEGVISQKEFDLKMIELENIYPFSIEDDTEEYVEKLNKRFQLIKNCISEAEELLIQMIKDNKFNFDAISFIFCSHIKKHFNQE